MFGLNGWIAILWTISLLETGARKNEDYHDWVQVAIVLHVMIIAGSLFGLATRIGFVFLGECITLVWFTPYTFWYLYQIWPDYTMEKRRARRGWFSILVRF